MVNSSFHLNPENKAACVDSHWSEGQVAPPKPVYLLLWLLVALALYVFTSHLGTWALWDAKVYARALHDWRNGQDPYSLSDPLLLFVYPPVFLYAGGFLARVLPADLGWFLYLAVFAAASLALPFVLARFYLRRSWFSVAFAYVLAVMLPRFTGLMALRTGNITNIFYFVALAAAIPGMRKNRWGYFYAVIFLIVVVKVNFLIMLLLPLWLGRRQWVPSILCGLCAIATYPVQKMLWPQLFAGFKNAASQQITGHGAYGYGVMRFGVEIESARHHAVGLMPYVLQVIFILVVIGAMFALRRRLGTGEEQSLWPALVVLATILCNPRILPYDSDVALLAGFVLLVSALRTRRALLVAAVIFLPSVAIPYVTHQALSGLYETVVLLISFAAGYGMLWRQGERAGIYEIKKAAATA